MADILVAEDEPHVLRILSLWLSRHGHLVHEARNGEAALELLEKSSVDLIISDMNMPVMNGCELAKAVREEKGLTIPFLMITSRCDQEELASMVSKYDVKLYPKPFTPSRLVEEIERLLDQGVSVSTPTDE